MDEVGAPPKVSVVMTSYNGEKWIHAQITSILSQISPEDELIICDDQSSDSTTSIIAAFNDPRITLFINPLQLGPWNNVIQVLAKATGDIIMVSDQDDIWSPTKYQTLLNSFTPTIDLIMHDAQVIDNKDIILYPSYFVKRSVNQGLFRNLYKNGYTGCFLAFRKSLLTAATPFPENIPYDQWLGLCAEIRHSALHLPVALVQWRRHGENVTTPFDDSHLTGWKKWKNRLLNRITIIRILVVLLLRIKHTKVQ